MGFKKKSKEVAETAVEELQNTEEMPAPVIEKVSISSIKEEIKKQEKEEFDKQFNPAFDRFIEKFKNLTPEEQDEFFRRNLK